MRSILCVFLFFVTPLTHASYAEWRRAAVQKLENLGYSNYQVVKELETATSVVFVKHFAKDVNRGDSQTCHLGFIIDKRSNFATTADGDQGARDYLLNYGSYSETTEDASLAIFWLCGV